jgi:hypothetical protein
MLTVRYVNPRASVYRGRWSRRIAIRPTPETTEKHTPENLAFTAEDVSKAAPPVPPASALRSTAALQAWLGSLPPPPESSSVGDDLNWDAPWIEVTLRVELPFWLMVDDAAIPIEVGGHTFLVLFDPLKVKAEVERMQTKKV